MSTRKVTRRRLKKYQTGDLRERICLHKREITAPVFGVAKPTETYDTGTFAWAFVITLDFVNSGQALFNQVNVSTQVSHLFVIRYRPLLKDSETPISKETVIRWRGDAYKIEKIIIPEERKEYMELFAKHLGDEDKEANT